ncbi:MAG: hypothetical protein UY44_C0020G0001, partial [Candidatus Kaiserbacteria bacterium GW2011_GWA2_49_19]
MLDVAGKSYFQDDVFIGSNTDLNGKVNIVDPNALNIVLASSASDATNKSGRIGLLHYTLAEEPIALITGGDTSTDAWVNIGGGETTHNTARRINFFTAANNTTTTGTERMRLTNSGLSLGSSYVGTAAPSEGMIIQGNVGIGTTGPGAQLHVKGLNTAGHTALILRDLASASTDNSVFKVDQDNVGDDQPSMQVNQDGTGDILQLLDTATPVFVVKDGGNVGIGTTGPGRLLDVAGKSYFQDDVFIGSNT